MKVAFYFREPVIKVLKIFYFLPNGGRPIAILNHLFSPKLSIIFKSVFKDVARKRGSVILLVQILI